MEEAEQEEEEEQEEEFENQVDTMKVGKSEDNHI